MATKDNDSPFREALNTALKQFHEPTWLGQHSPLAEAYFLGEDLLPEEGITDPQICGRALQRLLRACVRQLGEMGAVDEMRLLEKTYFEHVSMLEAVAHELNLSRSTYFRVRPEAIARLEEVLIERVRPALRLETPINVARLIGRDDIAAQSTSIYTERGSLLLSGASGSGKTALGASLFRNLRRRQPAFWFTFRPSLNDKLSSLLFSLGYFMHRHGAPTLWLQMVATIHDVEFEEPDWEMVSSLCRHALDGLKDGPPLLCFDDVDCLMPDKSSEHARVIAFLDSLRGHAALVYMGQNSFLNADTHVAISDFSFDEMVEFLAQAGLADIDESRMKALHFHTAGNPRLLSLCRYLYDAGYLLDQILEMLSSQPSIEALVQRLVSRLDDGERSALFALAVFRRPAPVGMWRQREKADILDRLATGGLVQLDDHGAVYVTPAYRKALYHALPSEQRQALHELAANVRESVGEFSAALHHYVRAGMPEEAIRLWRIRRVQEINQGQGPVAAEIFRSVDETNLPQAERQALRLINAALARLIGDYASERKYLEAGRWLNAELQIEAFDLAGDLAELDSEFSNAETAYTNGLRASETLAEGKLAIFHKNLGFVFKRQKLLERAWTEASLARYEADNFQGLIRIEQRRYAEAQVLLSSALSQAQELGHSTGEAKTRVNLARIAIDSGDFETAFDHLHHAVTCYERIGRVDAVAGCKLNWATGHNLAEQPTAALPLAADALDLFEMVGSSWGRSLACQCLAESHLMIGDLAHAEHYAQQVIHEEETDTLPDALRVLGEVKLARSEFEEGERYFQEAIRIATENRDPYLEGYAWRSLMVMHLQQGRSVDAEVIKEKTISIFSEIDLPNEVERTVRMYKQVAEQ